MKSEKPNHKLPQSMEDIRSGRIFDVPPGYFEKLDKTIFDALPEDRRSDSEPATLQWLKYWPIAASVALLVMAAWWINRSESLIGKNLAEVAELHEFIQEEIMEYDIETLAGLLPEDETTGLFSEEADDLETYIMEHIEDFDPLSY